jgi:pimeloyl-ACP methyl ester carboxylesterase
MERMFGFQYEWTDERRATADKLDFVRRAPDLVEAGEVPLRIVAGEEDALAELPVASKALIDALSTLYSEPERASFVAIPGLGHGLAEEPGFEPAPQNDHARQVDAAIVEWLKRWLPA